MKKITTIFLSLFIAATVFAQPNKGIDSAVWKEHVLLNYKGNTPTVKGGLLDISGNFYSKKSVITTDNRGSNNFVWAFRNYTLLGNSNNNFVFGENGVITNTSGSRIFLTDGEVRNSLYANVASDASKVECESCNVQGFSNQGVGYYFDITGFNNKYGVWGQSKRFSGGSIRGSSNTSLGNYNNLTGTSLSATGDYINLSGHNVTQTIGGWGYGHNGKILFWIYTDGSVHINGVRYSFPASQGAPGSVLTNDGTGNLIWSSAIAETSKLIATPTSRNNKPMVIYATNGQLLGYGIIKQ